MSLDPVVLARIQFGANITFHILFPTISIALAWVLLFFKLRYRKTGDEAWMAAHVDEDFQIAQWGEDEEAAERRATRLTEMNAAAKVLACL